MRLNENKEIRRILKKICIIFCKFIIVKIFNFLVEYVVDEYSISILFESLLLLSRLKGGTTVKYEQMYKIGSKVKSNSDLPHSN